MSRQLIRPGDVLLSQYLVERVLGSGGMGFVVAVKTTHTHQRFAIKVMLPNGANHPDIQRRFMREARACMRLKGQHTTRVHDVGQLEDGSWFMLMEHLDGMDLKAYLAQRGPLPPTEALEFVRQACVGLSEAHEIGIIHRDIKPGNLFLTRQTEGTACIKVLDFGIAKQPSHEVSVPLTGTGAMLGSPLYMSPEQMTEARAVDQRTDIWSLGVVLYELLTGTPPFKGETFTRIVSQVLRGTPKTLRSFQPQWPIELDSLIMRCLDKDPDKRFASMNDLLVALQQVPILQETALGATSESPEDLALADTLMLPKRP